ncbi:MAG: hypothetical protein ACR2G5_08780 [Pyrinomonadaceae bacterium]
MEFERIWAEQCRAAQDIKRHFGVKDALDYLLSEKLVNFAEDADRHPEFAAEFPRFQAAVWDVFNPYEIAGYLGTLKPKQRNRLRRLLYIN